MSKVIHPHVLVVEDHHDSRDMVCDILESYGFRVSAAMSADAAMAVVGAGNVAVIVTDISLAGSTRDGVWLLHQVAPLGIPVIAVSGHAERGDEFRRLGFAAVLMKPLDLQTLAGALHTTLEKVSA